MSKYVASLPTALLRSMIVPLSGSAAEEETARQVGTFELKEPLGKSWYGDWIDHTVTVELADALVPIKHLQVLNPNGTALPRQCTREGKVLGADKRLSGEQTLDVLTRVNLPSDSQQRFRSVVTSHRSPTRIQVSEQDGHTRVRNGRYEATFHQNGPHLTPIDTLKASGHSLDLVEFQWLLSNLYECPLRLSVTGIEIGLAIRTKKLLARIKIVFDPVPQTEILRLGLAGGVLHWQPGNLENAAFDDVHEAEIADDPRERPALGVAAALNEKRRGG